MSKDRITDHDFSEKMKTLTLRGEELKIEALSMQTEALIMQTEACIIQKEMYLANIETLKTITEHKKLQIKKLQKRLINE